MPKYKKRKDGLYQVQLNLGRKPDGGYKRKTIYARTIRELENKLQLAKADINNGIAPGKGSKITFDELSALWVSKFTPNVSERSREQYKSLFANHINPVIGNMRIAEIKKADLLGLINELNKRGASQSQLKKIKMIASASMELAVENRLIPFNPFRNIKINSANQKHREAISDEQKKLIIENWKGHNMGVPALIMLLCGLRRGEIMALQWEDINFELGTLTVNKAAAYDSRGNLIIKQPKTMSGIRVIGMPDLLLCALKQIYTKQSLVCPSSSGGIMTYIAFKRAWESYLAYLNLCAVGNLEQCTSEKTAAFQPFTPHQLRHTYATMLYSAGVDLLTAQRLLGHSNINTTIGIYTHLEEQRREKSISAFDSYISSLFYKV